MASNTHTPYIRLQPPAAEPGAKRLLALGLGFSVFAAGVFVLSRGPGGAVVQTQLPESSSDSLGYLGLGYDVIRGDPWPSSEDGAPVDPGWRRPVLVVEGSALTYPLGPCGLDLETKVFGTAYEFQAVWSAGIRFSDQPVPDSRFTGSRSYAAIAQSMRDRTYSMTSAFCPVSEALLRGGRVNVTEEFRQRVRELPLDGAEDAYRRLVADFGTHYADGVTMGAKAARLAVLDRNALNANLREGLRLEAAARADFASVFGLSQELQEGANLTSMCKQTRDICVGPCPSRAGGQSWHDRTFMDPAPIGASLQPLELLLNVRLFPEDHNVDAKREALKASLARRYGAGRGPTPMAYSLAAKALEVSRAGVAEVDGLTYVVGEGFQWTLGGVGDTCNYVCDSFGGGCEEGLWPRSEAAVRDVARQVGIACSDGVSRDTSDYDPFVNSNDLCYWSSSYGDCSASDNFYRRFCPCQGRVILQNHHRNSWASFPMMPTPRLHTAVVADGGKLYVLGGHLRSESSPLATVEAYSPSASTWYKRHDMLKPRVDLCATSTRGNLYAMGGAAPGSGSAERYDVESNVWERLPDLVLPRSHCAATMAGSCVYVAGGLVGAGSPVASVERWCTGGWSWAELAPMKLARASLGLEAVGGSLFAIGGMRPNGEGSASVERADLSAGTLSWRFQTELELAVPRFGIGTSIHVNSSGPVAVLLVGGQTSKDGPALNHTEVLMIDVPQAVRTGVRPQHHRDSQSSSGEVLATRLPESMSRPLGYVGWGYDAVHGEPWPSSEDGAPVDPGWRRPVLVADGSALTYPLEPCGLDLQTNLFGTATEFQAVWSAGLRFSGQAALDSRFIGSSTYSTVTRSRREQVYSMTMAFCPVSETLVHRGDLNVTGEFRQRVRDLPWKLDGAEDAYSRFVADFGTHYADSVTIGAKAGRLAALERSLLNARLREGFRLDVAARADFASVFGLWHESRDGANLTSMYKQTRDICVGRCPSAAGAQTWHERARRHPAPIGASLRSLELLLDEELFPEDHLVDAKRYALQEFLGLHYAGHSPVAAARSLAAKALNVSRAGAAEVDGLTYVVGRQDELQWTLGDRGKSCNEVCGGYGGLCEDGHWPRSAAAVRAVARQAGSSCSSVESIDDENYVPCIDDSGTCYWYSSLWGDCGDSYTSYRRFCPCRKQVLLRYQSHDSWIPFPMIPTPRHHTAVVADGVNVYVLGGRLQTETSAVATVEGYSPSAGVWYKRHDMLKPRMDLCATAAHGSLYAIGGVAPGSGSAERYGIDHNRWEYLPDLVLPRSRCAAAVAGSCVYVAGGLVGGGSPLASVERWCTGNASWEVLSPMRLARAWLGLAAAGGALFAIGGMRPNGEGLTSVERADISAGTLSWRFDSDLELAVPRFGMGVSTRLSPSGPAVVLLVGGQSTQDGPALNYTEALMIDVPPAASN